MADSIEDMAGNFFLKLFLWQIQLLAKGAVLLVMFPFILLKDLFCRKSEDGQNNTGNPT